MDPLGARVGFGDLRRWGGVFWVLVSGVAGRDQNLRGSDLVGVSIGSDWTLV